MHSRFRGLCHRVLPSPERRVTQMGSRWPSFVQSGPGRVPPRMDEMGLRRRTLSRSWNRDKPSERFAASVIRSSVTRSRSGALKAGFAVFRTRTSWDETTRVMWRPAHALRCRNLPSERPFDGLDRKGGTSAFDHRGPCPGYALRHDAAGER